MCDIQMDSVVCIVSFSVEMPNGERFTQHIAIKAPAFTSKVNIMQVYEPIFVRFAFYFCLTLFFPRSSNNKIGNELTKDLGYNNTTTITIIYVY